MYSPLEQFGAIYLFLLYLKINLGFFLDFSFFHIIIPLILISILLLILISFSGYLNIISINVFQRFFEYTIKFILNLIKQQIGPIGYQYIVLIYSIFFLVLLLN